MKISEMFKSLGSILGKGSLDSQVGLNSIKSKIDNENSNNIYNSKDVTLIGVNNGIQNLNNSNIINNSITTNNNITISVETTQGNFSTIKLKDKIKEILSLQSNHKYREAINSYNELITEHHGDKIDDIDLFEVFLNILLCYVNLNDDKNITKYIDIINELNYKDDNRFSYVKAIHYFYNNENRLAYEMVKDIYYDDNYIQGYILQESLECLLGLKEFNEMEACILSRLEHNKNDNINNKINSFITISNVARKLNKFSIGIKYLNKILEISNDKMYEVQLAYAYFQEATKDSLEEGIILPDKVDFEILIKAMKLCEDVMQYAEDNNDVNILLSVFEVYGNIKFLLGKGLELRDKLEKLSLIKKESEEDEYIKRFQYILGISDSTDSSYISNMDILSKQISELAEQCNYRGIINLLQNDIWTKYKENKRMHYFILDCYLKLDMLNEFVEHFRQFKGLGVQYIFIEQLEATYYEKKGEIEKATGVLKKLCHKSKEPEIFLFTLKFYKKYNMDSELEILIDDILINNKYLLDLEGNDIYCLYFDYLLSSHKSEKALYILNNYDLSSIDKGQLQTIKAHIYSQIGNYRLSAVYFEEAYRLTYNATSLYNAAIDYRKCNNLLSLEKTLKELLSSSYDKKQNIYVMLSDLELLKGDIEKSFDYCTKALDLVIDYPKSEIHGFFAFRGLRCGKEQGIEYIVKFKEEYPKIENWVKSMKALDQTEEGKDKPTKELMDFFNQHAQIFDNLLGLYKEGSIGFSNIAKLRKQLINDIFDWRNYYNIKINIFDGVLTELVKEINIINNSVVIDAIGLYVLQDIDALDILNTFSKVFITYSTIEYLQQMLLHKEDQKIRDILKYLSENLSIEFVSYKINGKLLLDNEEEIFDEYILESLKYARENKVSFIYGDSIIKKLMGDLDINLVGLIALINKIKPDKRYKYLSKLKMQRYTFVNFNYMDLYNIAKENNYEITSDLMCFFQHSRNHDLLSFMRNYLLFLYKIYKENKEEFDKFYILYVNNMDKIYKKSFYYIYSEELYVKQKKFNQKEINAYLLNSPYYNRGLDLRVFARGSIACCFALFDTEYEKNYYTNLLQANLKNISLDQIINVDYIKINEVREYLAQNY